MHRRGMRGRKWWLGLPVAAALALPVPPTGNAPVVHAGTVPPVVVEFDFTGAAQTWTVPAGVSEATFDVFGAQGGSGNIEQGPEGHPGGLGGRATATIAVTAGSTVTIMVGGKGDDFVNDPMICNTQGGFNGGGDAGAQDGDEGFCGQGGGGASDVRIGGANLSNRVLVAGGGGGASVNLLCPTAGAGGGAEGTSGECAGAGAGGNQSGSSGSGQLGVGGNGVAAQPPLGPGGGGGGGHYGGSGGSTNGLSGGGGSGSGPAGTVFATGVREGHGHITVTYDAPLAITANLVPASGPAGTTVTITGRGFNPTPGATLVNFGPYPATEVSCSSTTQCTAVSPSTGSNDFELVFVTVSTPGGPGTTSNPVQYIYVPMGLALTEVSPASGPAAGGTPVTFRGVAFETTPNGTLFFFGPIDDERVATAVSCTSSTECTGLTPPGTGSMTVTVATLIGGQVAGPSFTYAAGEPPPTTTTAPSTTTTAPPTTSTSSTTSSSTSTSSSSSTSTTQVDASTTSTSSTASTSSTSPTTSLPATSVAGSTTDPATSTTAVHAGVTTTRVSGGPGTLPRTGASGWNTSLIVALALVVSGAVFLLLTHRRRGAS